MSEAATTKMSSKGQVVIPEEIRDRLGLKPGAQFVVLGDRDVAILKVIQAPDCADPADDKFLACAAAAGAQVIVSGDRHLLAVSGWSGIEVLRPRTFVERHLADLMRGT